MRNSTILSLLFAALFIAVPMHAQSVYSDTYVIPIVGHTAGAFGSTYLTDVSITNFNNTALTVQLIVVEQGENMTDNVFPLTTDSINGSVIVPARNTVVLRDILNGFRGMANTSGALILGGDKPFAVSARLYNLKGGGVGDTIPAITNFFENSTGISDNSAVAYIPGLISNASFRSNIGLLAATGSASNGPLVVEVKIVDGAGNNLGTRIITTQPGQFTQTQFGVTQITNTPFDIGSAEIRILSGSGVVIPYAAVNDNATGSAQFIQGMFPQSMTQSLSSLGSNIFRGLFNRVTR